LKKNILIHSETQKTAKKEKHK